jgi:hypothetical protein
VSLSSTPPSPLDYDAEDCAELRRQLKKVGTEMLGGFKTDIYELKSAVWRDGQSLIKLVRFWLSPALPCPVRHLIDLEGNREDIVLKSATLNTPIDDRMFDTPKDLSPARLGAVIR